MDALTPAQPKRRSLTEGLGDAPMFVWLWFAAVASAWSWPAPLYDARMRAEYAPIARTAAAPVGLAR